MSGVVCQEHYGHYCYDSCIRPTFFVLSAIAIVVIGCPLIDHYYLGLLRKIESELVAVKNSLNEVSKITTELSSSHAQLEQQFNSTPIPGLEESKKYMEKIREDVAETIKNVKKEVKSELQKYDADKTGKADFALENAGGSVITTRGTETYSGSVKLLGASLCGQKNSPNSMIQAIVLPGECWAFRGSVGSAVIHLIAQICVTAVTLEHIPLSLSPTGNSGSAPNEFSIWGISSITDDEPFCFGQFHYDINGATVQTFEVQNKCTSPYSLVELKVHSNHGNPNYTCVYRLRIHGKLCEILDKGF